MCEELLLISGHVADYAKYNSLGVAILDAWLTEDVNNNYVVMTTFNAHGKDCRSREWDEAVTTKP